jgi:hypothetical protein
MKIMNFVLLVFWTISLVSSIAAGGGGIVVGTLEVAIDEDDTAIVLEDGTDGWLASDSVIIDSEEIAYTSITDTTLNVSARGYNDTDNVSHEAGARVYSLESSIINRMMGYYIGVVADTDGWLSFIKIPIAVGKLLLCLFTVDLSFLGMADWISIVENMWTVFGIGMFIWFAFTWRSGSTT